MKRYQFILIALGILAGFELCSCTMSVKLDLRNNKNDDGGIVISQPSSLQPSSSQ